MNIFEYNMSFHNNYAERIDPDVAYCRQISMYNFNWGGNCNSDIQVCIYRGVLPQHRPSLCIKVNRGQ